VSDDVAVTDASPTRVAELLLGVISHDLRSPLTVILGTASALGGDFERFDPVTRRKMLGTLEEEAERLGRRIDMLVAVARSGFGATGRLGPDAVARTGTTFDRLVEKATAAIGASRLAGRMDVTRDGELPPLGVDEAMIAPILTSLIERALDQSRAATKTLVRAARDGAGVAVEVDGPLRAADRPANDLPQSGSRSGAQFGARQLNAALFARALGINGGRISVTAENGRTVTRLWLPAEAAA